MAEKKTNQKTKTRRVAFSFKAPGAKEVRLVGDFNNWNVEKHPMKKEKGDAWKKIVMISPGRYEYKFLVDGEWWTDPGNDQTCTNRYGTRNSIIMVA